MSKPWFVLLLLTALSACTSSRLYIDSEERLWQTEPAPPASALLYQAFLIGDAGRVSPDTPVIELLKTQLDAAGPNSAVVFLGDNIYPAGMPDSTSADRARAEARLLAQLQAVKDAEGRIVFIPGNHDWNKSRPGGLEALARQKVFIETFLGRDDVFLPAGGFPGPVEVELTDDLTLVVLDTEWLLTNEEKSFGDAGDYDLEETGDFFEHLDDLIVRNRRKDLLVVGHHPLRSNGTHNGYMPTRDHLFPLTNLVPGLYLPLPLIGSLYPLYMQYVGGSVQDLPHIRYRTVRALLTTAFLQHERLIYASGHEHNLQYFRQEGILHPHQIISGSGSGSSFVLRGRGAAFTSYQQGMVRLDFYRDGTTWMEVLVPEGDGRTGTTIYRTQVLEPASERVDAGLPSDAETAYPDYRDSTVVAPVQPDYKVAGSLKASLVGQHYRETWSTPVAFPVLDLANEAGGLTPIKRGGGVQSTSLRLQGADGREYVLRSIDKDATRSLEGLLGDEPTLGGELAQDQVSVLHPYGAFLVPHLADAVGGISHTNPRPVYVPHDDRLGTYKDLVGGQVMLFEERPDDDMSDLPSYGGAKAVISATQMFQAINDDNDHRVDDRAIARARLFDLLIADWDRHSDQWRWASFEPYEVDPTLEGDARNEGKIYRPIPRDRDWAFHTMDGLFPTIARFTILTKYQGFREKYGNLKGLTLNGLYEDRRFLAGLTRDDWVETAENIRTALTDASIESAVRTLPEEIYAIDGERFVTRLKARREKLPGVAENYYSLLAGVPDVVGSNKHERFEVKRLNKDETEVTVFKTSKEGTIDKELYRRTFNRRETKEIRLYGLDGDDHFIVSGDVPKGIRIRAVGGLGDDTFVDSSRVGGPKQRTLFYDSMSGNTMQPGSEAKTIQSDDPSVNRYDPFSFLHDVTLPQGSFRVDKDDGLVVAAGAVFTRHGFRKTPFARQHRVWVQGATLTRSFNAVYQGLFTSAVRSLDLMVDAEWSSLNNIRNFYGLGNETKSDADEAEFYQARIRERRLQPALAKVTAGGASFYLGPKFWAVRVAQDEDRFIAQPQLPEGVSEALFDDQFYTGALVRFSFDALDNPLSPRQGFRWQNDIDVNIGLHNAEDDYATLRTDLTLYLSPSLSPQVTVALRAGAAHNIGDFPFYSANALGGRTNLRGYRSTRFSGRTSFYHNVELRTKLFDVRNYLILGEVGLLAFLDNGRVWTDGEQSSSWHQGYGAGLWMSVFDVAVMTTTFGFSEDDFAFALNFGFFY